MTKFLVSLFALGLATTASADLVTTVSKVSCKTVGVTREGTPDETAINAWLKETERETGVTGSVSVSFIGNGKYLVCRSFTVTEK